MMCVEQTSRSVIHETLALINAAAAIAEFISVEALSGIALLVASTTSCPLVHLGCEEPSLG